MGRFRRVLTTAVLTTLLVGGTAGWASASSASVPGGPLPGTAAWLADDFLGRELPDPGTATPAEVAAFFAGLSDVQRHRLAEDHPAVVGNLDASPCTSVTRPTRPPGTGCWRTTRAGAERSRGSRATWRTPPTSR